MYLKLISQEKRVPWERGCTVYTRPQGHLRFQDGGRAVYSDRLVIVRREMFFGEIIDDLSDQSKEKNTRKNGSRDSHGSHDSYGSHRGTQI